MEGEEEANSQRLPTFPGAKAAATGEVAGEVVGASQPQRLKPPQDPPAEVAGFSAEAVEAGEQEAMVI